MTIKTFEICAEATGISKKIDRIVKDWIADMKPIRIISTSMAIAPSTKIVYEEDITLIYTIIYEYKNDINAFLRK